MHLVNAEYLVYQQHAWEVLEIQVSQDTVLDPPPQVSSVSWGRIDKQADDLPAGDTCCEGLGEGERLDRGWAHDPDWDRSWGRLPGGGIAYILYVCKSLTPGAAGRRGMLSHLVAGTSEPCTKLLHLQVCSSEWAAGTAVTDTIPEKRGSCALRAGASLEVPCSPEKGDLCPKML